MTAPRSFTDENMEVAVAAGATRSGLVAHSARDLGRLGLPDEDHLAFCTEHGFVLVTHDVGIRRRHWAGEHHAGILYVPRYTPIGTAIEWLELVAAVYTAEEMINRLESIP